MSALNKRRWGPGLVMAAVATLAASASIVLGPPSERPVLQWLLVTAAAVTLVLARSAPFAALIIEVVLVVVTDVALPEPSHVATLAAALALGAVAYRHSTAWTVLGWFLTLSAVLVNLGREAGGLLGGADGALRIVSTALAVAAPAAIGRYLAALRQAAAVAEERARDADERREVETHAARMTERTHIAGELHDLVAHHVSAIALTAGSARYAATHAPDPQTRLAAAVDGIETIHTSAREALVDLRGLLHVLRDPNAPDMVLNPEQMIADAVERSRAAGLDVTLTQDARAVDVALAQRVTAARVLQEAFTNALKHAGAGATVSASLTVSGDELRIEVANTLRQVRTPALPPSGHGLTGMRERVQVFGGTLTAGPVDGSWKLTAVLPLVVRP
ncbi:sensor histidine kinase [Streptomyces rubiginosohelvolus]|uniref:sensor histidine kinase n=1 Tax=Streptomyces rubiginosohelvolus TaxID=67362 RepID=UPI0036485D5D